MILTYLKVVDCWQEWHRKRHCRDERDAEGGDLDEGREAAGGEAAEAAHAVVQGRQAADDGRDGLRRRRHRPVRRHRH